MEFAVVSEVADAQAPAAGWQSALVDKLCSPRCLVYRGKWLSEID